MARTVDGRRLAEGPLAVWDDDESTAPQLVWWAQLDGRYLVEVDRSFDSPHAARLRVFDHDDADELLLDEIVMLADDAAYGPAVEDVAAWQARAISHVDAIGQGPAG